MPIRSAYVAALVALALVCVGTGAADARIEEPMISYLLHYFSDVDGVDVYSHYANTGIKLNGDVALSLQWGHDVVVFPAIDAPPGSQEAVDAITTASRPISANTNPYEDFVKVRDEVESTLNYGGATASYYVSTESDYFAQMVTFTYNHDFAGDNLNLAAGVSYGWDDIKPLQDDDTAGITDYRNTLHFNLIATQVVTSTTVFRLGGEFNQVRGLQHDPYRNVYVSGTNVPEAHPKTRDRWDMFCRVSQYITNRSSVQVDYRYYSDDWGVESHTIGGRLSQYVSNEVVVRYRYRYYTQAPSYFYRDDYSTTGSVDGFQTGDYRLGEFGAHLFGGEVLWYPHRVLGAVGFMSNAHFVFSYEHYFNSNNFSANIYETGLRVTF